MKKDLLVAGLFNSCFGALSFFVIASGMMSFIYIADAAGWIIDPTLEPGMLPVFLLITAMFSAIYFPSLIYINISCWKKTSFKKRYYTALAIVTWFLGLAVFYLSIRSL